MDMSTASLAYVNLRAAKRELEDRIKELDANMELLEQAMLQELKAQGAKSINTDHASVQYQLRTRYYTTETAAFRQWVVNQYPEAVELFENRLHQGNVSQWLEQHPDAVPPGLNTDTKETVRVVAR